MLADDLTGACDSGVQFTKKGLKAVVSFDKDFPEDTDADVIIFDTNSRAFSKEEAYGTVAKVSSNLSPLGIADETLKKAGIASPKIAVCGINPHAGENGLFGNREEEEKIIPAVEKAVSKNIKAFGPLPADTVFFRANRGDFDIAVAMYHDQACSDQGIRTRHRSKYYGWASDYPY